MHLKPSFHDSRSSNDSASRSWSGLSSRWNSRSLIAVICPSSASPAGRCRAGRSGPVCQRTTLALTRTAKVDKKEQNHKGAEAGDGESHRDELLTCASQSRAWALPPVDQIAGMWDRLGHAVLTRSGSQSMIRVKSFVRDITRSLSATPSSTRRSPAFALGASAITPIRGVPSPARSIICTAVAASTSRTPTVT